MSQKDKLDTLMEENGVNAGSMELWHVFSRVFRNGRKSIEHKLDRIGIKPIEVRVLLSLYKNGPSTMNALSTENDVTGPWITGIVEELEKEGFVTKERGRKDRRVMRADITSMGVDILLRSVKVYAELIQNAFDNLDEGEAEQFSKLLKKIEGALEAGQ